MRSVVSYALIAIIGGVVGAAVTQSGGIYDQVKGHFATEAPEAPGLDQYGY